MADLFIPFMQPVNVNGSPLAGAKLYFYQSGTTDEITTYQDADETTPHTNPVLADATGMFPPIYVAVSPFKTVLTTAADVTVQTVDPVSAGGGGIPGWTPASSSGPASLEFAEDTDSGTNTVTVTAPASLSGDFVVTLPSQTGTLLLASQAREVLTANRTYYVRSDGNDSNTGLTDSSGGAFLTLQKAMDVIATIDFGGYTVTVQIADGTYAAGCSIPTTTGQSTAANLVIQGNAGTPANVLIQAGISVVRGANARVKDVKITTASGDALSTAGGMIEFTNIDFGVCAGAHIQCSRGGYMVALGDYSITGNAARHWFPNANGTLFCSSRTITLTGTPAFSNVFARCDTGYMLVNSNTFSGSATGTRYSATLNGVINTNGGGATYLPGDAGGSVATGGQYA